MILSGIWNVEEDQNAQRLFPSGNRLHNSGLHTSIITPASAICSKVIPTLLEAVNGQ